MTFSDTMRRYKTGGFPGMPVLPMTEPRNAAYALVEQVFGLDIAVTDSKVETLGDSENFQMELKIDPDDVETSAFGLIFTIAVLSFHDARPCGNSEMHFDVFEDGTVKLLTINRGQSAARWITKIQGKKGLSLVSS